MTTDSSDLLDPFGLPNLPADVDPASERAKKWIQGAARRRDGWALDQMPYRGPDYDAGWTAMDTILHRTSPDPA